jgi:hypothetical protein
MKHLIALGILGMLLLSACSLNGNVVRETVGYCDYRMFEGQEVQFCKPVQTCDMNRDCTFLNEDNIKGKCIDGMCLRYCLEEKMIEC